MDRIESSGGLLRRDTIRLDHLTAEEGNASYRNKIIDAVYHLTPKILDNMANFKILQKEAISL